MYCYIYYTNNKSIMNKEIEIVKELMTKYGLTNKDLFSFCICAVNFMEYYHEESMYDMMRSCPDRYASCDSNNTRAVAGALSGEKKEEGWTDVEQFAYYMENIQSCITSEIEDGDDDVSHFLEEYERFAKVYKREVMIPIMLGCPVESYDDSQFYDEEYIKSIINVDNLSLYRAYEEQRKADVKAYLEKEAAETAKEVEARKSDKDFSVVLASCVDVSRIKDSYENYNKKYYPDRGYKVIPMKNPRFMIIQTGGKSIEDVKDIVLRIIESQITIIGHEMQKELVPIENAFKGPVPEEFTENSVTHVVTYF